MAAQLHHPSTLLPFVWNLEVWKHSEMRLICRTTDDRWIMALSEARTDGPSSATLRALWMIGKTRCMQAA